MSRRLSLPDAALGCVLPKELLRILDRAARLYRVARSEIVHNVMRVFLTQLNVDECYRFAPPVERHRRHRERETGNTGEKLEGPAGTRQRRPTTA